MRKTILILSTLTLAAAAPVAAGPPWISAEYPANPFHADTRGALLLIHSFHHGVSRQFPMTGTAEGLVNGKRQTVTLRVERTYREGVYAVRGELPKNGSWAVVINLNDTDTKTFASLIASVGPNGEVLAVNVPTRMEGEWMIPQKATQKEIDAALNKAVKLAGASKAVDHERTALASIAVVGLMVTGAALRRKAAR